MRLRRPSPVAGRVVRTDGMDLEIPPYAGEVVRTDESDLEITVRSASAGHEGRLD